MQAYLDPYQQTEGGRPKLAQGEIELQFDKTVSIYFGTEKKYRRGQCTLSTHRIFWTDGKVRHALHLKHIKEATTKSGFVGLSSPKIIINLKPREVVERIKNNNNNNNRYSNLTEAPKIKLIDPPKPGYMMLSFHTSGRDSFLSKVLKAISQRGWIIEKKEEKREFNTKHAGIGGILREQKERQQKSKETMNLAFKDLEGLMEHAKDMVRLANKLASSQEVKENENEYDELLQGLGLSSPVTKESSGTQYHTLLARQLCDFLLPRLPKFGNCMTLTDIYCIYNRARGTELISPDDLLASCKLMSNLKMPVKLTEFKNSGVLVIELINKNDKPMGEKLIDLINKNGPLTELKLANLLNISINLASQHLNNAEQNEFLCRDDSSFGTFYYKNFFTNYKPKRKYNCVT